MNSKVNGEHKEKVLQRWEGGDSNSDDYDLESDMVGASLRGPCCWVGQALACRSFLEPTCFSGGEKSLSVTIACSWRSDSKWKGTETNKTKILVLL